MRKTISTIAATALLALAGAASAQATNQGTEKGNNSGATKVGCSVNWNAQGAIDPTKSLGEQYYKGLDGKPVNGWTNGGFLQEVTPVFGDPGRLEVQHYSNGAGADQTIVYRVHLGTHFAIDNGQLTIDLPEGFEWTSDDATEWGVGYQETTGGPFTTPNKNYTIDISNENSKAIVKFNGVMPASSTTTISLTAKLNGKDINEVRVAKANLKGNYLVGTGQGCTKTPGVSESNPLVGVFQVDQLRPKTKAQARTLASLDNDNILRYREDKPLWGASKWEFVTIYAKDVKRAGSLAKAIDAKTRTVGNLTGRTGTVKVGRTYVQAWKLGKGATTKAAWGPRKNVNQTFYGVVKVPAYRAPVPTTYSLSTHPFASAAVSR